MNIMTTLFVVGLVLILTAGAGAVAPVLSSNVFAQTENETETAATITGETETSIINQTTIPAEQTNITVEQTTEQVGEQALEPLGNLSVGQPSNLTEIENRTVVEPTGPATTTIVNTTQIPFNQTTTLDVENQTQGQQQQQQQQEQSNQSSGGGQEQQQGPLEQMGEAVGDLFQ